jgi:predicted GH43/DUF377 family glycosyl hydrolase
MGSIPRRLLTRCLLRPGDVTSQFAGFEVIGTFNPAAIAVQDGVVLMVRVAERPTETRRDQVPLPFWDWRQKQVAIDWRKSDELEWLDPRIVRLRSSGHIRLTFLSWILIAYSRDGLAIDRLGEKPLLPETRYETFGIEDPRLAEFDGRFHFTYIAVSEHGIATALGSTTDFQQFERHGIIFCPENKDVILFPEKIDGKFVALHRPNPNAHFCSPEIWIARSPDLLHWGGHQRLLGSEAGWASVKVGGGTPPVRTPRGWLSIFHGHMQARRSAGQVGEYAAATLLLDEKDPGRIVGASPRPVMVAETDFERQGYLPDIVFPTAIVPRGDQWDVYYGAADTATGVVRYDRDELLATVRSLP